MTAPLRRRTRAREIAMQALFQFDLRGPEYASELGSSVADVCRTELLASESGSGSGSGSGSAAPPAHLPSAAQLAQSGQPAQAGQPAQSGQPAQAGARKLNSAEREIVDFAARLVDGTLEHRDAIDQKLQSVTRNWDLRRMAIVDRNVLRMAVYELMFCADVPPKVAINEAIEIGKKFSTANSGKFVNGILDRIRIDLEQQSDAPGTKDPDTKEAGTGS